MSRSTPPIASRLIGNIIVLIGVALAGAWLFDVAGEWWTGHPTGGRCWTLGLLESWIGGLAGFTIFVLGAAMYLLSGLQRGEYLLLSVGGLFVGVMPAMFAQAMGLACTF